MHLGFYEQGLYEEHDEGLEGDVEGGDEKRVMKREVVVLEGFVNLRKPSANRPGS